VKKRNIVLGVASLALCFSCLFSPKDVEAAQPKYVIKFATVAPEGSAWMKQMEALDREIRSKSKGQLGFRIYAGGVAGDELDVLKKIHIGQIQCAAFSGVGFGQILPMVRVLDLPFLFRNDEEVDLVRGELRPFFAEEFRKKGFEILGWAEVGNVNLLSKKPIERVKDFAGLKVWTWSGDPIAKETFTVMGVNPIPLAITDVTTGLNTGMIDTVYAPPLGALALQWYRSLDYIMALPLAHSTGAVLISSKAFNSLPRDLADLLTATFDRSMKELTPDLRAQNREAVKLIAESGLKIVPVPSGNDLAEFYSVGRQVAENLQGKIYPRSLLDRVYDILKRTR
jgi:TRAP-type C4-dicarboxylate transport system substrate-binding protein